VVSRSAVLALAVAGALGCGGDERVLHPECLSSPDAYLQALQGAPERAVLPDSGTPVSTCASDARSDGDLQNAGVLMVQAADRLALRAQEGERAAALQLGFLAGAVAKGAATTQGIQTELARRVVRAGALLGPEMEEAYLRGLDAGRERG
jgi:hypothetical protein